MTEAPASITYESVVSRDSVRVALTISALRELEVKVADIINAYLCAPNTEKNWTVLGPEFGEDTGKKALIFRALYGQKSSGVSFRNHISDCLRHLGYTLCRVNADIWMKPAVPPGDGFRYYPYVLTYVDEILVMHNDAMTTLNQTNHFFKMNPESMGDLDIYLGGKLRLFMMNNGVERWSLLSSKCMQEAVRNGKIQWNVTYPGIKLPQRAATPFVKDYLPELNISEELNPEKANYYQSLIGIVRWMIELGRINMITEVSLFSFFLAIPRRGHLEALFHIFAYLDIKHNSRMIFDPTHPEIDMSDFKICNWKEFDGSATEALPPDAPLPLGKEVDFNLYFICTTLETIPRDNLILVTSSSYTALQ